MNDPIHTYIDPGNPSRKVLFYAGAAPGIQLIDLTSHDVVALATRGYAGEYSQEISQEEVETYWRELNLTKLKTPLEMAHATFLIRNVTRSFTHQLVRYRIGTSFVQESLRFSVQNDARIIVPGDLLKVGSRGLKEVFIEQVIYTMINYWSLIDNGAATQDARALLPHCITTNVFAQFSMLALANIYQQRACCQAQEGEWGAVVGQIRALILGRDPRMAEVLRAPWQTGATTCGFGASFDRPCIHQKAFDTNAERIFASRKEGR